MRRFVVVGRRALSNDDFLLDDLPSSSGRLDVLLRCLRAALLVSNGIRRDVIVYLVLQGSPGAPRVLRADGASVKFLRPDERSLAVLVKKALRSPADSGGDAFVEVRPGIAVRSGGLDRAIDDLGGARPYVLDEGGHDLRSIDGLGDPDTAFFTGDDLGFDGATRSALATIGARPVSVGPVSLHAEDVVAVISNEIDRCVASR